jgi:hypothetical protein
MMRTSLVVLYLLVSVVTASAGCAWVLWEDTVYTTNKTSTESLITRRCFGGMPARSRTIA